MNFKFVKRKITKSNQDTTCDVGSLRNRQFPLMSLP